MKALVLAAAALVSTATLASAHDTAVIDRTQAEQLRRIEQGRYTGELTRREYRELLAEQARVAQLEQQAKADGRVTRREFHNLRQAQADASRHISSESSDHNVSFWRRWLYRTR